MQSLKRLPLSLATTRSFAANNVVGGRGEKTAKSAGVTAKGAGMTAKGASATVRSAGMVAKGAGGTAKSAGVPANEKTDVTSAQTEEDLDNSNWPRKIFSGIQPTGSLHLGNYLGAVQKWTKLQNSRENVTYCIVDMHSITLPKEAIVLRQNILQMAATMMACGIDPDQSTVFVQSSVKEHTQLCWILSCLSTMARLGHLPQYKEKSRLLKEVPLGLFVYPVLQAADIMLYKTTHVPVGEDQLQHIQLAQHLARNFNTKYGQTFPICHAMIENKDASRIRSLRDPTKKMSKSDPDQKATINLLDEPEVIVEKIKKAVTDFISDVKYQPGTRAGVSNLIAIHSLVTGDSIEKIVEESKTIDTGRYKLRVADAVVAHLKPIREEVNRLMEQRLDLVSLLEMGAHKARETAQHTMAEVCQKVGLGAQYVPDMELLNTLDQHLPKPVTPAVQKVSFPSSMMKPARPIVPKQEMRVEKIVKNDVAILLHAPKHRINEADITNPNATEQTMLQQQKEQQQLQSQKTATTEPIEEKESKEVKI